MTWVFLHFVLFQSKRGSLRQKINLADICYLYLLVKTLNNIKTEDFFCDIWTMEFIKVIHIVKLWLDAMPKSVVAHSISMTSRRKTTIQGVSTGRAWIWCDAATISGAAAPHHGPDIPKFVQKLLSLYWILTESLFKKGLGYANYNWKYFSNTGAPILYFAIFEQNSEAWPTVHRS